jgi:hypothetical protein
MPQNTNLNISPYFDDFDKDKNFYRVLFRPGFPIQARELTTMQSILQNQVEAMGSHLFKEGAMVIPGQVGYDLNVDAVIIQQSFLGVDVETYRTQLNGKIVEGLTTGIKAKILFSIPATDSTRGYITFYVKYVESGDTTSDTTTKKFQDNEQLICENEITFGNSLIEVGSPFAQLLPVNSTDVGSAAYISEGVYFIRGHFVDIPTEYIILEQYDNNPSYRVGFDVSESIITPEDDPSLTDNAIGSSNYSAPGAHRFRIKTQLVKKPINDDTDKNFIELLRIRNSTVENFVDRTEYNEIEKSIARRTFETHGDYVVDTFEVRPREHLNDQFNNGVYLPGTMSPNEQVASENFAALEVGPGKAYVKGYRTSLLSSNYVDAPKPRTFIGRQNQIVPIDLSQSVEVYDIWGWPSIAGEGVQNCYQIVDLRDNWLGSGPSNAAQGNRIGKARVLQLETDGTRYNLFLFDIQMFTALNFASSQTINDGEVLVGRSSGARGYVYESSGDTAMVHQVSGQFQIGEVIERDGRVLDTLSAVFDYEQSDVRQVVGYEDPTTATTVTFTASLALNESIALIGKTVTVDQASGVDIEGFDTAFAADIRPGEVISPVPTDNKGSTSLRVKRIDAANIAFTSANRKNSGLTPVFDFGLQTAKLDTGLTKGSITDATYTASQVTRLRPIFTQKNIRDGELVIDMPKKAIKSITDESFTSIKTFYKKQLSSGDVTFTLPENEQFTTLDNENYNLTIVTGSNSNTGYGWSPGDNIDIENESTKQSPTISVTFGANRQSLQITGMNNGSGGSANITRVTLTAAVSVNTVSKKIKTAAKMRTMKVIRTRDQNDVMNYGLAFGNLYGTRIEDEEISFALNDVYKVHAVYESTDDNDAQIPYLVLTENVFFDNGSVVVGRTSGARGRVVSFNSNNNRLYIVPLSSDFFGTGETIDGFDGDMNALVGVVEDGDGSVERGSRDITGQFELDPNQTPFMYGVSKIVRKPGTSEPKRKLAVVFDYFIHEPSGDYFSNQSYSGISFSEIPKYRSERNSKDLTDGLDFRPGVGELASGSGTVEQPYFTNCKSLDFDSRVFTSTGGAGGSTIFNIPKVEEFFRADYDYYLPRQDKLFMTHDGELKLSMGVPNEDPPEADDIDKAMLIAKIIYEPYVYDVDRDILITLHQQRRYTMEDIGNMDRRLQSLEYYTSLTLLENDARNARSFDSDGFDRLKNGFLVDDFTDHGTSATEDIDFKCSMDFNNGILRPSHYTSNVSLEFNPAASSGITDHNTRQLRAGKTGANVLTLPYVEEAIIIQPYASRQENVNPFNVFTFIGRIDLVPASDDWTDTRRAPTRVTTIEGDFVATRRRFRTNNAGFAPVQWNAWRTNWTGTTRSNTRRWRETTFARGTPRRVMQSQTITTTRRQVRSGTRIRVVPRIDRRSLGDSIIDSTFIPWIRSRNVAFDVERVKPKTRMYGFFDGDNVMQYITPKLIELVKNSSEDPKTNETPFVIGETVIGLNSGCRLKVVAPNDGLTTNPYTATNDSLPDSYASQTAVLNIDTIEIARQTRGDSYGNIAVGEVLLGRTSGARAVVKDRRLISDLLGIVKGTFFIPNPRRDANPRWATGARTMRLTSSETDSRTPGSVDSAAEAEYTARGTLNTLQENVLAVRNASIVRDTVSDTRTVRSVRTNSRQVGWWDPLAQSFLLEAQGGMFVTGVDIYFATKDQKIPISMQIRPMENGYPTKDILPFSDCTLIPSQVEISENASIATKFEFPAPVYIPESEEHCFVLFSDSNEYKVWISRMGDIDITGTRTISEQPYAGVLFKSQNASTWTADQYEDLKFNLYRAKFTTNSTGSAVFNNASLGAGNDGLASLVNNPITTIQPQQNITLATGTTYAFTVGSRVIQSPSNAQGTVKEFDSTSDPQVLTVTDISGTFVQGIVDNSGNITNALKSSQSNATIVLSAISNGVFEVGDVITGSSSGATATVTAYNSGTTTLSVNYVDKAFDVSNDTLTEPGGVSATISSASYSGDSYTGYPISQPTVRAGDKKVIVYQPNHGMHNRANNVEIKNVVSEIPSTTLTSNLSSTATTLSVNDASSFHQTINGKPVSTTNPGYLMLVGESSDNLALDPPSPPGGDDDATEAWRSVMHVVASKEIVAYSAISSNGKEITVAPSGRGITSAVMNTGAALTWPSETTVRCYNLDGIPLTEINKIHTAISDPTLDTYSVQTTSVASIGISTGGSNVSASQNIPFELITPTIQILQFKETDVAPTLNTTSGTSIGTGGQIVDQASFVNNGQYDQIQLNEENYYDNPRIICSNINEANKLEGAKSLTMRINMTTEKDNLTPVVDLDRVSVITTSNRINQWPGGQQVLGIQSEIDTSADVSLLSGGDQNEAVYLTKIAKLANISRSIRLMISMQRYGDSTIDVYYRTQKTGSDKPMQEVGFVKIPVPEVGSSNVGEEEWEDFEYTVEGQEFQAFQVKIVMKSLNQAKVPLIKDLRAIAFAS